MYQKLVPDQYLILVNSPKYNQCVQGALLSIIYFERRFILKEDYQKSSKDPTSFLFSNPVSFYKNYEKRKVPETSYQSLSSLNIHVQTPVQLLCFNSDRVFSY